MSGRSEQAKAIFLEAIAKHAPEAWPAFLQQACGPDADLRARVERLLRAQAELGPFQEEPTPTVASTGSGPVLEAPGMVIGPYKLLEQIGEGGFAVVFMAEQHHPVRRKVALKVLRPGMETRQVIARFEAERQALALMDHPHIACVFDGGETASGRPYFVMELVKGIPIVDYCDENQLTPRERLEIFVQVCQAVQHAHQKGIIHRDLKPSNVLVTLHDGTPVVKVIDFGIAKATGQQLTEKTLFTNFAQLIGTPLYMSPEQATFSGLDVDTRSDIYSLGVLLYELLTGTTPFEKGRLKEVGYDEILRIIREEEPPKPSTRISTLGQAATTLSMHRKSDPRRLTQLLRGELDWIVIKCLEKDRNRRYQTANSLAVDVLSYLHDEPVQACPPSALYRFGKFARRNRAVLTTVSFVALALVAGAGVSIWLAVRATRAEALAQSRMLAESKRREQARAALDANTSLMLGDLLAQQQTLTEGHKKFLQQALEAYKDFAADTAEDEASRYGAARAFSNIALISRHLSPSPEALAAHQEAVERYGKLVADFPGTAQYRLDLIRAQGELAVMLSHLGRPDESFAARNQALAVALRLVSEFPSVPDYQEAEAECYQDLANMLEGRGRRNEAERAVQGAIALLEPLSARHPGPDAPRWQRDSKRSLAVCLGIISKLRVQEGNAAAALEASRRQIQLLKALVAETADRDDRLTLAQSYNGLGNRLKEPGPREEAYRDALGLFRQLAADFPTVPKYRLDLAICLTNWGVLLTDSKRPREAEPLYQEALRLTKRLTEDYPAMVEYRSFLATVQSNFGSLMLATDRYPEAEAFWNDALAFRKALAADSRATPAQHHSLAVTLRYLGELRQVQKQYRLSCDLLQEAIAHHEIALKAAPRNPSYRDVYRQTLGLLAHSLVKAGDHAAAAAATARFLDIGVDPVNDPYEVACLLSQCASLAEKDAKLSPKERKQTSESYANRAIQLLGSALNNGFKGLSRFREDRALDPLRSRKEFKDLLAQFPAREPGGER
jgi:serine/threonine protein kinase/tetratricopeptide (TPR) repeat protein